MSTSRREILTVAAATVTLPMLDAAVNKMRTASAATPTAPARGATATATAPAEKPGWFTTTLKPADLKDGEFTLVEGHTIVIARTGKTAQALSAVCTHRQCAMKPTAGAKVITCTCHKSEFNLDSTVAKAPATKPLPVFAARVNDKGLIEIDPGVTPKKEDKEFSITIA